MNTITITSNSQPDVYIILGNVVEAAQNDWRIAHQTGCMTDETFQQAHKDLNNALYGNHNPLDQMTAVQTVIRTYGGK